MSFTVHVTMVTEPKLFSSNIGNHITYNLQAQIERTSEGDIYCWTMHNKAIKDPLVASLFDYAVNNDKAAVRLTAPEVNDEVDVF